MVVVGVVVCVVVVGIVSARWRAGVGVVLVNFAPDRSLGRKLGPCWRSGVLSAIS